MAGNDAKHWKNEADEVLSWIQEETGYEISPVDAVRADLLCGARCHLHAYRNAAPCVETPTGVKSNPEYAALLACAKEARMLCAELEKPVLAKRAAAAEQKNQQTENPTECALREQREALAGGVN